MADQHMAYWDLAMAIKQSLGGEGFKTSWQRPFFKWMHGKEFEEGNPSYLRTITLNSRQYLIRTWFLDIKVSVHLGTTLGNLYPIESMKSECGNYHILWSSSRCPIISRFRVSYIIVVTGIF